MFGKYLVHELGMNVKTVVHSQQSYKTRDSLQQLVTSRRNVYIFQILEEMFQKYELRVTFLRVCVGA